MQSTEATTEARLIDRLIVERDTARDERLAARTERFALALILAQAPHADTFCTAGSEHGQAECVCWKAATTADVLEALGEMVPVEMLHQAKAQANSAIRTQLMLEKNLHDAWAAITAVRQLHQPVPTDLHDPANLDTDFDECQHCSQRAGVSVAWPCETMRAMEVK